MATRLAKDQVLKCQRWPYKNKAIKVGDRITLIQRSIGLDQWEARLEREVRRVRPVYGFTTQCLAKNFAAEKKS